MSQSSLPDPVFMVGSVRSGTTLLRLMLDHHPEIAFVYESQFLVERIGADGSFPSLESYWEYLDTHRSFIGTGFTVDRSLEFSELLRDFLEQRRQRDGKRLIGATVHRYFERLLHVWPQARFLHIVRDGRDVSRSRIAAGWAGNGWYGVERWLEVEELWDRLRPQLADERVHEVRYEDLISDPRSALADVCVFFGTDFDESMFDYTKSSNYAFPDKKLAYRWKKDPGSRDTRLAEARAASMLGKRGYELSGNPILEIGALSRARLRLQNTFFVQRQRLASLGLGLWLTGIIARKLRIKPWVRHVTLKANERKNKTLK